MVESVISLTVSIVCFTFVGLEAMTSVVVLLKSMTLYMNAYVCMYNGSACRVRVKEK